LLEGIFLQNHAGYQIFAVAECLFVAAALRATLLQKMYAAENQ